MPSFLLPVVLGSWLEVLEFGLLIARFLLLPSETVFLFVRLFFALWDFNKLLQSVKKKTFFAPPAVGGLFLRPPAVRWVSSSLVKVRSHKTLQPCSLSRVDREHVLARESLGPSISPFYRAGVPLNKHGCGFLCGAAALAKR